MSRSLQVHLASCTNTLEFVVLTAWRDIAASDQYGLHHLTNDPASADLILFVDLHLSPDWKLRTLQEHPLLLTYREKVLVYDERDQPWCVLPGLYCSMPAKHFSEHIQKACAYYKETDLEKMAGIQTDQDLLFSFMGARSHPIRQKVLQLVHPRAIVEDTSGFLFYDRSNPVAFDQQKTHYLTTLLRSKFIICPRGAGTASIRLFETLAAGRVPVIISDDWVAPPGPDWNACSLRVPEAEIAAIPALLEAAEARYPELSAAACDVYQKWFAQPVIFHRMMEMCAELLAARATAVRPRRGMRYLRWSMRDLKHQTLGALSQLSKKLLHFAKVVRK